MNPLLLLKLLSPRAWLAITIMAGIGIVYAGHLVDVRNHEKRAEAKGRAAVQASWDAAEKIRAVAAAKAEAAARAEETRRAAAQSEIIHAHELAVAQSRADADAAAAAAGRLRQRIAAILAGAAGGQGAGNPAAAVSGPPADDAARMCAELLGRADTRLRIVAAAADASRAAGNACEASYDALTAGTPE